MKNFFNTFKARWNYHMKYRPVFAAIDVSICIGIVIGIIYMVTN